MFIYTSDSYVKNKLLNNGFKEIKHTNSKMYVFLFNKENYANFKEIDKSKIAISQKLTF